MLVSMMVTKEKLDCNGWLEKRMPHVVSYQQTMFLDTSEWHHHPMVLLPP